MRKTLVCLSVIVTLVGAACGGDTISENLAENLLENELGGDVDINIDGDGDDPQINIETDEGSISIGGGSIPDELTVAVPSGGNVTTSFVTDGEVAVVLQWPLSEFDSLVSFYDDWTGQQPTDFAKNELTFTNADGVTVRNLNFYSSETEVTIGITECPTGDGDERATCVNILESSG
jgi:hypothetical protein